MEKQLEKLNEIVKEYYSSTDPHGDDLIEWMKGLSSILFYLTTEQVKHHKTWNSKMYMGTKAGESVAAMKIVCDKDVPELYMLRKIISAGYKELDVMRSSLSYLKSERDNERG